MSMKLNKHILYYNIIVFVTVLIIVCCFPKNIQAQAPNKETRPRIIVTADPNLTTIIHLFVFYFIAVITKLKDLFMQAVNITGKEMEKELSGLFREESMHGLV